MTKSVHPSISVSEIIKQIKDLYLFAIENPELEFIIIYSGTKVNLNGYSNQEMADMFSQFEIPKNVIFEYEFSKLLKKEIK